MPIYIEIRGVDGESIEPLMYGDQMVFAIEPEMKETRASDDDGGETEVSLYYNKIASAHAPGPIDQAVEPEDGVIGDGAVDLLDFDIIA